MREMIQDKDLELVSGGAKVSGAEDYLPLYKNPLYANKSELAQLHNGDKVEIVGRNICKDGCHYKKVFVPRLGYCGYVDSDFLK